jgi:hypothetical protein
MTSPANPEPLEAFAMPPGAIELEQSPGLSTERSLAVAALRQALAQQADVLPFGPETGADEVDRLLTLNRVAVQLVTAGIAADELQLDCGAWEASHKAPQLVLAALVDEENAVVSFPGVLTGPEVTRLASMGKGHGNALILEPDDFKGGIMRLFTLVQLVDPECLPRVSLASEQPALRKAVAVMDWLRGQVDATLLALGAELSPLTAGAFRGGAVTQDIDGQPLAVLLIPLGLTGDALVSGDAAVHSVRSFQLALIATGNDQSPGALVLRVSSTMPGALLPDGLQLAALQGGHSQTITSNGDLELELRFQGSDDLVSVSLRFRDGEPIELPPLQLPL